MKHFLIAACLLFFGSTVSAQTWAQKLGAAERDYEEGRLAFIPERLEGGFLLKSKDGGYSKEETVRALKLITKVYIFIDDEPKAEEYLVRLLKADKEHKLNPQTDPAELYFLYQKFRSKPIFRVGVRAGVNKSFPNVIETFGTGNTREVKKVYNGVGSGPGDATTQGTIGLGYWVEALAERHIRWGIEGGLGFQFRNSRYDVENFVSSDSETNPSLSSYIVNEQLYFRVPGFIRYNFRYNSDEGVIPYITAGTSYDYLINARYASASREGGTQYVLPQTDQITNLKDLSLANLHNWSVFGAAGVKLRVQTHFITLEMKYDKSLANYINPANRWDGNQYLTYDLSFVEDDLALDMLSFSVGYTYSIYSPKKLKEFR